VSRQVNERKSSLMRGRVGLTSREKRARARGGKDRRRSRMGGVGGGWGCVREVLTSVRRKEGHLGEGDT
jgi:hypothetical protein